MCSLNDCRYNDDETSNSAKDLVMNATQCRKCRFEDVDVLLVGQSGYCKTCFLTVINHKFRAALGKSKIIRQGDTILVDHSGELNSTVLLHLIKAGMSESTHKKLIFKTIVLYIDDSVVTGRTNEEKSALQHKIAEEIKDFGFNGYVVSMSQVLSKEDILSIIPIDQQQMSNENDKQLCAILANLLDETSRTDLLSQLRRRLLLSAAQKLNCNKVFIADSVMDIATKVLGDICLGRGAQLGALASFCDARCSVKILKPMRDFTQQELLYYSKYHKIETLKLREPIDTMTISATSIQTLARNFTINLDSQFSGTGSTIFRTAEKVNAKFNEQQDVKNNCVLCDTRLDFVSFNDEVSAMRAIAVSKRISAKCGDTESLPTNKENETSHCIRLQLNNKVCSNGECNCKKNKEKLTDEDIWRCLCYSCRQIFQNSEILSTLPTFVIREVQQRMALESMREEINDFLL